MAKRSKKRKKGSPSRRRRRVSGVDGQLVQLALGVVGASIGGRLLSNVLQNALSSTNPTIAKWGIVLVEGVGGYMLAKKSSMPILKGAGIGLMAAGGGQALTNLGVSLGSVPILIPARGLPTSNGMVSGYNVELPRVNGISNAGATNATPNGGWPKPASVGRVRRGVLVAAGSGNA